MIACCRTMLRLLVSIACVAALFGAQAVELKGIKVFPVKDFFFDATEHSVLDARFLDAVKARKVSSLVSNVASTLNTAFAGKIGPLDINTAGHTFAVSFHIIRATSYSVDKGNGNSDVVATVTASLYFTNVITGEILTTFSDTVVGRAVISNADDINLVKTKLFSEQIDAILGGLVADAATHFNPTIVDTHIVDRVENLFILDAGFEKGIQIGDSLDGATGELIQVVYAAESYSVATRVLADNAKPGDKFQKVMAHPADGKVKPPAAVVAESVPDKFNPEYVKQIFTDAVGSRAPFSTVQINVGYANLLRSVMQDNSVSLSASDLAKRRTPELFIRLRVAEPIIYEAGTNLDFKKVRHYETVAFADVVDTSGRVNFSAIGKDVINDDITRNIGPGFDERREVSVKNALVNLAEQLAKLGDVRRDQTSISSASASEVYVSGAGKVFSQQQKGFLLHKLKVQFGKESRSIWVPSTEAFVDATEEGNKVRLSLGLPWLKADSKLLPTDVFEVERLGATPRSANTIEVCGPSESLGSILTPSLMDFTEQALGHQMPGMLYVPSIKSSTDELIGPQTNFVNSVKWKFPAIGLCVQPVERVNSGDDVCSGIQCERPLTARYTLRVKASSEVLTRTTFETQFKSTGFYKTSTPTNQIQNLIYADLIDEAQVLLDKAADKLTFVKQ